MRGELPRARAEPDGEPLPVAIGRETASRNGIEIGQQFDLHPFWDEEAEPRVSRSSGSSRRSHPTTVTGAGAIR